MGTRALILSGVVCLLACSSAQSKTLVFCSEGNPETLNPQVASTALGTNAARPIFDNLVQFKPGTTEIIPGLAETWSISPDGKEYVFHLRRSVHFHSRPRFTPTRDFNADDVLFSINRQWRVDHPFHTPADGKFDYFEDLGLADLLDAVEKIDDWTVRIKLTHADAPFLTDLAMPFAMVLSEEYAKAMQQAGTPERLDREPIGTGPFVFESFQKDVSLRYTAFASYWAGRPAVDNLAFSITTNAAVRLNKLAAGECQIIALPNLRDADRIRANPDLVLKYQDGLNIGYLALNAQIPPFNDLRVRRAVNLAIDKATIVKTIYRGAGTAIKNPLPANLWSYNDAVTDYDYNPTEAARLMAEAGLERGLATELWYMPISRPYNPASKQMAEMMAADLSRIGIHVELKTAEWAEYRAKIQAGVSPMALYGWIGDNGDPDNFLAIILGCHDGQPGPNNIAKWCNAGFDDLIAKGKLISDQPQRADLYRRAQLIAHDEAAIVPLAQSSVLMAMRKSVTGFMIDPLGRYIFDNVKIED